MHLVAVFNLLSTTYMFNFISRLRKRDVVLLSPYKCGGVSIKKYMMVWKGYLFCQNGINTGGASLYKIW